MATAAPTKTKPASTGSLIDRLWATREEKRRIEAELKEVDESIKAQEETLMLSLDAEGLEKATGKKASVSVSSSVSADVQDWDEFWKFIFKNKLSHLLQRRVSDPAYRELLEAGKKVPGVQPFSKKRLNLRSLNA